MCNTGSLQFSRPFFSQISTNFLNFAPPVKTTGTRSRFISRSMTKIALQERDNNNCTTKFMPLRCSLRNPLRYPISSTSFFDTSDTPPRYSTISREWKRKKSSVVIVRGCENGLQGQQRRENFFQALNRLMLIEADDKDALRSKRTIGILREVFPEISQVSRC